MALLNYVPFLRHSTADASEKLDLEDAKKYKIFDEDWIFSFRRERIQ